MIKYHIRLATAMVNGFILLLMVGCASAPSKTAGPVFFPPPPNLPRVQYLMGINSSEDVEGKLATFSLMSVGGLQQKKVRPIIKPYGITAAAGKLYVADIAGQLIIIDLPKKSFELLKGNNGFGKLKKPVNVAVDSIGFLYVADVGRKEVVVYDQNGEFLKTIGNDLDMIPSDVAVDSDRIYILDTKKGLIKIIDRTTNTLIKEIGKDFGPENSFSLPMSFTLDKKGIIYVTNAGSGKVVSCDRDGNFLGAFGQMGDGFGQFSRPKGLAVDDKGLIYVVDSAFQNVQVFSEKGRVLTFFGGHDIATGGMNLPSGITLTTENVPYFQELADKNFELDQIVFVANQFGNPKISVYGFGKQKGIDYEKEYKRIQEEREKKAREFIEKQKQDEERLKKEQGKQPQKP